MRPNNPAARSSAALGASNSTSHLSTSSGSTASDPPYNTNAVASGSGTSGGSKSAPASPGRGPTDTKDPSGIKRSLNFEDADSSLSEAESEGEEKKREEKKRKIPSRRAAMNPLNARPPATKLKPSREFSASPLSLPFLFQSLTFFFLIFHSHGSSECSQGRCESQLSRFVSFCSFKTELTLTPSLPFSPALRGLLERKRCYEDPSVRCLRRW